MGNDTAVCYNSECKLYNSDLNYCKETEYGVEYGTGYDTKKKYNHCGYGIWNLKGGLSEYSLNNYYTYTFTCQDGSYVNESTFDENGSKTCVYTIVINNGMKQLYKIKQVDNGNFGPNDYMPIYLFEGLAGYMEKDGVFITDDISYDQYLSITKDYLKAHLADIISPVVKQNEIVGLKTCLATENPQTLLCLDCYTDFGVTKQKYYKDIYDLLNEVKPAGVDVCVIPDN